MQQHIDLFQQDGSQRIALMNLELIEADRLFKDKNYKETLKLYKEIVAEFKKKKTIFNFFSYKLFSKSILHRRSPSLSTWLMSM
jgi:hypothetical protein